MAKTALITGVTGQDGALLAEHLLEQGYIVHGIKRRTSQHNTQRIDHLYLDRHNEEARLFLHYGDLSDATNVTRIIQQIQPDEIYNLGAMSHVHVSFEMPLYTGDVDALGIVRVLEAVRLLGLQNKTKIYQAATSEIYGNAPAPQNETTSFEPCSPYAAAKLYAYWMVRIYREAHGMFACNGILFNHESPVRGETFVTRKITRAVAQIALGKQKQILLGNLNAQRDWGHAKDYVKAMHLMLQQPKPEDFVIATGVSLTVREFATLAFKNIGLDIEFKDQGEKENGVLKAIDELTFKKKVGIKCPVAIGDTLLRVLPEYFRPLEVNTLRGDASKARKKLNWEPSFDVNFLVNDMVESDIQLFKNSVVDPSEEEIREKIEGKHIG